MDLQPVMEKLGKLDTISDNITKIATDIKNLQGSLEHSQSELDDLKSKVQVLEHKHETVQCKQMVIDDNSQRIEKLETYSRRDNLIVHGLREQSDEKPERVVQDFFRSILKQDYRAIPIIRCHRLGLKSNSSSKSQGRPMIIRFLSCSDKTMIWSRRRRTYG